MPSALPSMILVIIATPLYSPVIDTDGLGKYYVKPMDTN